MLKRLVFVCQAGYSFITHRCTHAFSRYFRRITVRLPGFSGGLGDTRAQYHYQRPSPDDLLQTPGMWQRPDATADKSLVRGSQQRFANGGPQSGHRRHVNSTPIREGAEQYRLADHARKHNRLQFLLTQCWVTLGVSVLGSAGRKYVLPIVSR